MNYLQYSIFASSFASSYGRIHGNLNLQIIFSYECNRDKQAQHSGVVFFLWRLCESLWKWTTAGSRNNLPHISWHNKAGFDGHCSNFPHLSPVLDFSFVWRAGRWRNESVADYFLSIFLAVKSSLRENSFFKRKWWLLSLRSTVVSF